MLVGAVACAVAAILFTLWWVQERVVFQPPRELALDAEHVASQVPYTARDGQPLFGYFVGHGPHAIAHDRPTVLAFHGNAEVAAWLIPWARELSHRAGVSVFLAEYRGYAGLSGPPTYAGTRADAIAAHALLCEMGMPAARCVLFGHSLGTAVAAELARDASPAVLILQAPFTSARAMAARVLIPSTASLWRAFSRVHFDTVSVVRSLSCPVYVAHGALDRIVPLEMGRQVYGAARVPGEFFVSPHAGHNDVAEVGGEDYWSWLLSAIDAAR